MYGEEEGMIEIKLGNNREAGDFTFRPVIIQSTSVVKNLANQDSDVLFGQRFQDETSDSH